MNRETEMHFSTVPQIELKRSKFDMSHSHKTSMNGSEIIPIYVDSDILPGDTVQVDMASLIRMATPIYPIMDNLYADIMWFFCPHRLVMDHWKEFWGENNDPWTQSVEYEIPYIKSIEGRTWKEGDIADYMGVPTKVVGIEANALPFRAYAKIWSDWFRDENLQSVAHLYTDETNRDITSSNSTTLRLEFGKQPARSAKFHDRFTSCLPAPQKGPSITIPLGTSADVKATNNVMTWKLNAPSESIVQGNVQAIGFEPQATQSAGTVSGQVGGTVTGDDGMKIQTYAPANLYADLSQATAATISALRTAFAIQKYYENASMGTRYIEYIKNVFGVTSSDARIQRTEYLGGQRIPLNIDQILQTSATDSVTPQGNTAGFSCTLNRDSYFTKSFEEHGTLMCLVTIRTDKTYQQGLHPMWSRKKWVDFYNPYFANLSNMPVYNRELYAQGNDTDKQVFGYQEAWSEYRYRENRVSGYMRSNATGSLDVWHFADDYSELPTLSSNWISDNSKEIINRTIAVTSQLTHQFIADFYFKMFYTRPMPVYSIPGLIDHV